ncbi:MAG: muconolactone Delta-isomerase family protein [Bacteroidota bacterium]
MQYFIADIRLPEDPEPAFFSHIPAQREMVDRMIEDGDICQYALKEDRSRLWVIFLAESEEQVWEWLGAFPMISWMQPEVSPLMFFQDAPATLPAFSLN